MSSSLRVLVSVSDKTGAVEFAKKLATQGAEFISTGGTAKALRDANLNVTDVSSITGFPEIMDGRVKTLNPLIHGGLLNRGEQDADVMQEHGIQNIDILVVNLYPFEATIAKPNCSYEDAIENIDIGGPAMIRAASKNHAHTAVVTDPSDYDMIAEELEKNGEISLQLRTRLAKKAFAHTACYDAAIWNYLQAQDDDNVWPERYPIGLKKQQELRYGENPHQAAAVYTMPQANSDALINAKSHQGKPLSFNNLADADAALECVRALPVPACVIVKHANPCGAAIGTDVADAYRKAYETDPTSAFGGIIAFNCEVPEDLAKEILGQQFVEVMVAPGYEADALEIFTAKPNVRVLECGLEPNNAAHHYKQIDGGMLVQDQDRGEIRTDELKVVTKNQPDAQQLSDAQFAWTIAKFVKSNAIVYVKNGQTVGVGAGQMSRVISAQIAGEKAAAAGLETKGAVMASDAFFPFRDGIDFAAEFGIATVIQPGGSMRDEEVIAAADEHAMTMLFTGMRHFRH
ncbi:MAG: bifunctional phosphoribosylaminoimidazolecarboxamide formyltransferase/IMP cyclohydrolase [Gammaproteobacteria bacterium]|nr:bifunctional phosphoribosylaminoimidazolecarboxamide formyltransferase/IMP cyclohydrolase [Gammaproteobacteria bacterium]